MARWPRGSLKLIQPMSMVLVPMAPGTRTSTEPVEVETSGTEIPQHTMGKYKVATIEDTRPAVGDVHITVTVICNLELANQRIYLILGNEWLTAMFASGGHTCSYGEQTYEFDVSDTVFNDARRDENGDIAITSFYFDSYRGAVCTAQMWRIRVEYAVESTEVVSDTIYLQPWSNHLTRVAGPGETSGVPHYHAGRLRVNARTGKFVVVSESLDGKLTLGGFQATPAATDGTQISGRPSPGSAECLLTGEVGGVVTKLHGDGVPEYE